MKNVKTLLILLSISTFVFASGTRVAALGGAGFWADDYANINDFPASVNNHNVAYTTGNNFATIFDHDGNKWGFSGGSDIDEVVNMRWGNGTYGARLGLNMSPEVAAVTCADGDTDCTASDAGDAETSYNIGFGMPLAGMDFGFGYDGSEIAINLRRAQDIWLWNNVLVGIGITPEDTDAGTEAATAFGADLYTNNSYGEGTSGLFAVGFHYGVVGDNDATMNLVWNFAVESAMTDWGTFRIGYKTMHDFGGGANTAGGLQVGLGINYGAFNLDMNISNSAPELLNDPIRWAAGRNANAPLSTDWTISYNW